MTDRPLVSDCPLSTYIWDSQIREWFVEKSKSNCILKPRQISLQRLLKVLIYTAHALFLCMCPSYKSTCINDVEIGVKLCVTSLALLLYHAYFVHKPSLANKPCVTCIHTFSLICLILTMSMHIMLPQYTFDHIGQHLANNTPSPNTAQDD